MGGREGLGGTGRGGGGRETPSGLPCAPFEGILDSDEDEEGLDVMDELECIFLLAGALGDLLGGGRPLGMVVCVPLVFLSE